MDEPIVIRGVSFEAVALERDLAFEPPLIDLAADSSSFVYSWKLINFVFDLPNPKDFPLLGRNSVRSEDLAVLDRFVATARDLAGSSFIGQKSGVRMTYVKGQDPSITREGFPTREVLTGFATMFRQLNLANDESSFIKTHKLLGRANEESSDQACGERRRVLKLWRHAHSKLEASSLLHLVGMRLVEQGKMLTEDIPRVHDLSPRQLIEMNFNGDYIHWGDRRDELSAFRSNQWFADLRELEFLTAMGDLAHIYTGFAEVITAALSGHAIRAD